MSSNITNGPLKSLTAATNTGAAGTGGMIDCVVPNSFQSIVVVANGTASAGAVQLQGSMDNVNWFNIGTALTVPTSGTGATAAQIGNIPCRFVRGIVSTNVTGTNVDVWIAASGA